MEGFVTLLSGLSCKNDGVRSEGKNEECSEEIRLFGYASRMFKVDAIVQVLASLWSILDHCQVVVLALLKQALIGVGTVLLGDASVFLFPCTLQHERKPADSMGLSPE